MSSRRCGDKRRKQKKTTIAQLHQRLQLIEMSRYKKKEGVIFIINTGHSTCDLYKNESFLPRAKNVVRKLIERKMLLCPHDEVAYICLGRTQMPESYQELQPPNWEMLRYLMQVESSVFDESPWPEGLRVAHQHLEKQESLQTKLKIVLVHDFKEADDVMTQFNMDAFSQSFKQRVDYLFVGLKARPDMQSNLSEKLAIQFCERFNGQYEQLAQVEKEVQFFYLTPRSSRITRLAMHFLDIKLSVALHRLVEAKCRLPKMTKYKATMEERAFKSTNRMEAQSAAFTFKYGGKLTTLNEEELKQVEEQIQEGNKKSLHILGFLKRREVTVESFVEEQAKLILPDKFAQKGQIVQFFSFAQALQRKKRVAIARLVSKDGYLPKMVLLFPRLDVDPQGIICIQRAFTDTLFPITRAYIDQNVYDEENPLLDPLMSNLIDAGMLVGDEQHEEPLALGTAFSPAAQATWNHLSHRALHGGYNNNWKQVDAENQRLKDPLRTPDYILERSRKSIDDLKQLGIFKTKAAIET